MSTYRFSRIKWLRVLIMGFLVAALFVPSLVVFADDGGPTVETVNTAVQSFSMELNTLWVFLAAFLVFFMQAGFALVKPVLPCQECRPHMMMNIMVFCVGAIGYWATVLPSSSWC